jgi:hypothetical protein
MLRWETMRTSWQKKGITNAVSRINFIFIVNIPNCNACFFKIDEKGTQNFNLEI